MKELNAHEKVNQIFYKALSGESSDACSGSTTGASHAAPAQKLRPNEQGDMVEDHGGNFREDRIEANNDHCDEQDDYWSLRDEGRSYWGGESYAERNV